MIDIVQMTSSKRLQDVIDLFNEGVRTHPWSAHLDRSSWEATIGQRSTYDPKMVLIAYEGERRRGYVHLGNAPLADNSGPDSTVGSVEALFFPADRPDVGAALLAAARSTLKDVGARMIFGWSSFSWYPLYRGLHVGLEPMALASDRHVTAAFIAAGFRQIQHNVIMVADPIGMPPPAQAGVHLEIATGRWSPRDAWAAGSWTGLKPFKSVAMVEGEEAGHCIYSVLPSLGTAPDTVVGGIGELGTVEKWRRVGVAAVLVSRAVEHLRELGVNRLVLITQHDNLAAQATYERVGMRVEQSTVGFELTSA
jgi:ribosomal protein S18 acetylase RimI-like enzyme